MDYLVNTNKIIAFCHCVNCLLDRPNDITPAAWSRLSVGFTKIGLQVWCQRCDCSIIHIDFRNRVLIH
mgnify:CR=1 FL=1